MSFEAWTSVRMSLHRKRSDNLRALGLRSVKNKSKYYISLTHSQANYPNLSKI